ncbi:SMI1/KNR4 family protein [Streptomyces sp. NPDC052016]|uniref:SMI1/KNR4 family protein n=1 Tax=Streptomyces sp. NPDC052016 TaxID=3365680 RepID=UPI0037CD866B
MTDEQAVRQAWSRIQQAISRHPAAYPPLRPPAPQAALRALEEEVDTRVPPALRTLWGIHEGAYGVHARGLRRDFMDGHAFINLDDVQQIHHMFTVPLNHGLFMDKWGRAWDPAWIPVTSRTDRTVHASGHFVDADGRVGSWDDRTLTSAKHPTLAHYLHHVADRMT